MSALDSRHNAYFSFFEDPARPIDPARLALVAPVGFEPGTGRVLHESLTYGRLLERVGRLAAGLERLGVRPGDRVLVMIPMSIPLYETILALVKLGAVCLFIDPSDGLRQLDRVAARLKPRAYVATPEAHRLRLLCPSLRAIPIHIARGGTWWPAHAYDALIAPEREGPERVSEPVEPEAPCVIAFTSGSTGGQKGVTRTHGDMLRMLAQLARHEGKRVGGVNLCAFPLLPFDDLVARRTCVLAAAAPGRPARADPEALLDQVRQFPPALISCAPGMLQSLLEAAYDRRLKIEGVRHVYTGGGPLPMRVIRLIPGVLPGAQLHSVYGSTEVEPVAMIDATEILADTHARTIQGAGICLGRPGPDTQVRIVHPCDGPLERLDRLEAIGSAPAIGEIVVTGPHVNRGYFDDPVSTRLHKILDPETGAVWHRMGDLGYVDAAGRLWTVGRMTRRVTTPTATLDALCVELVVDEIMGVARSALVGVDVVIGGRPRQAAAVFVEPRPGAASAALRDEVLRVLAVRGVVPEWVEVVPEIPLDRRIGAKILADTLARRHGPAVRWILSDPFLPRLGEYLAERLPPVPTAVAAGLFAVAMASAVHAPLTGIAARVAAAGLLVFLFFFHLRIFDEEKDIAIDRVVHPRRVLSRGIVDLDELVPLRRFAQGVEGLLAAALGLPAFVWWLAAAGYSFLMRWEFFARETLRANLLLYGVTHVAVMLPLAQVVARGAGGAAAPLGLGILAALLALMSEIARKLEVPAAPVPTPSSSTSTAASATAGTATEPAARPDDTPIADSARAASAGDAFAGSAGEPREESYVRDLGLWPTVALLSMTQLGALAFGGMLDLGLGAGFHPLGIIAFPTVFGIAATVRFGLHPSRAAGKSVHGLTLLQALAHYGVLATRPLWS